jgi:hypothetical protein
MLRVVLPASGPAAPVPGWRRRQDWNARGYLLHLKNGSTIPVWYYQDKGDQVVIPEYGGTYGLSKTMIARIEEVKDDGREVVGSPRR